MLPSVQDLGKMRKNLGISQKEMAKMCGVSQSYIARMEKGDINPTYENVKKIYAYLYNYSKKADRMDLKASDIMTKKIFTANPTDSIFRAMDIMKDQGISQVPILSMDGRVIGTISESDINELLIKGATMDNLKKMTISRTMSAPLPQLPMETPVSAIYPMLRFSNAVLVMDLLELKGIITKADILRAVENHAEHSL